MATQTLDLDEGVLLGAEPLLPPTEPTAWGLSLLAAGVPLSLLVDLAAPTPVPGELPRDEAADTSWVPARL